MIKKIFSNVIFILSLAAVVFTIAIVALVISTSLEAEKLNAKAAPFLDVATFRNVVAQELNTKLESTRDVVSEKDKIAWYDVDNKTEETLKLKAINILRDLNLNVGGQAKYDNSNKYFKLNLDNLHRKGSANIPMKIATALGYYYVKISLPVTKQDSVSGMKKTANYIGINGAIGYDELGLEAVDEIYLFEMIKRVNTKRALNNEDPIDEEIEQIDYQEDVDITEYFEEQDKEEHIGISTVSEAFADDKQYSEERSYVLDEIENVEEQIQQDKDVFGRIVRRLDYDASEFNNISEARSSFPVIPNPNAIFKIKQLNYKNDFAGYSLYDYGSSLVEVVGKDISGVMDIVLIFKYNLDTNDYDYETLYIDKYQLNNFSVKESKNLIVSEFVTETIKTTTEELNCAYKDKDLVTLTSGNLIYPQDLGIKLLLQRNATSLLYSDIFLKRIIRKEGNTYLAEIHQLSSENPNGVVSTGGKFLRKWLMRFTISGSKCYIDDMFLMSVDCLAIPEFTIDLGMYKKLNNIAGLSSKEFTPEVKREITNELNKLQIAMNTRTLEDKLDDKGNVVYDEVNGQKVPHWGFESRFDTDESILLTYEREKYVSEIRTKLNKYSMDKNCKVSMSVASWISGNANQVELIIYEFYDYGRVFEHNTRYVSFNRFQDKWLIDQYTIYEPYDETYNAVYAGDAQVARVKEVFKSQLQSSLQ